ncbi:MAG: cysteine protease [Cytophagales bacterium]|nr:MAG: cysteine protease [Cytophagales bacterium]
MKKKHFILTFICVLFFSAYSYAQKYGTGMNFDDTRYNKIPKKAVLLSRDYSIIPASASLKMYCPTPRSQGSYGTCVGWSGAWGVRTILAAKAKGMTNPVEIAKEGFSPHFAYLHIKNEKDNNCQNGAFVDDVLKLFQDKGVPKLTDYSGECPQNNPDESIYEKASNYKIKAHATLFASDETKPFKLKAVKKALASGNPIIIGMLCPPSFGAAKGAWKPTEIPDSKMGGHAMCVVGYDDNQYGGAFEILNSWGNTWGNGGFIWIPYDTFIDFVKYAYEAIDFPTNLPNNVNDLAGSFKLETSNNTEMSANFVKKVGNVGIYQTKQPYFSGTKFRMYINNEQPAFVYALGSDLATQKVNVIFPFNENISPALNYKGNSIALPSEKHFVRMDNTIGKDYMCLLYSKEALDIEDIKSRIAAEEGDFAQKVNAVLGNDLVKNTNFQNSKISFSAKSNQQKVVAMILEVEHQ